MLRPVLMMIISLPLAAVAQTTEARIAEAVRGYYDSLLTGRVVKWEMSIRRLNPPPEGWAPAGVRGEERGQVPRGARLCWVKVVGPDGGERELPVTIDIKTIESVPVAAAAIPPRTALNDRWVAWREIDAAPLGAAEYPARDELKGLWSKVTIPAGAVITRAKAVPMPAVVIGSEIRLISECGNVTVQTVGKALEDGVIGEKVRVMNAISGKQLKGVVTGQDMVKIQ